MTAHSHWGAPTFERVGAVGFPEAGGLVSGRFARGLLRDTFLCCLLDRRLARGLLLRRRRPCRDGSPGTSRRSRADVCSAAARVGATEDREGPRSGNKDGLVTRRPLNCDHATLDVGHDAASCRLAHLGAHHLNLVTDFWHESLLTTLVGHTSIASGLGMRLLDGTPIMSVLVAAAGGTHG